VELFHLLSEVGHVFEDIVERCTGGHDCGCLR
jgi:hypothetical protein